jgi:hypothetical protein
VSEWFHHRIGPRENESNVTIVGPLHEVRRSPLGSVDLQDLRVAIVLAVVVTLDDQSISDMCLHRSTFRFGFLHCAL